MEKRRGSAAALLYISAKNTGGSMTAGIVYSLMSRVA